MPAIVDVLWLAGTFNAQGEGISATFANDLDPKRFRFRYVPYPADYGRDISYGASLEQGRVALDKAVRACPGRVVVGGYSQGAAIAGNYAANWADHNKVVGCALIADPLRDGYQRTVGHNPGGYGIGGARRIAVVPTLTVAAWGDPITALPAGNHLRSIADFSEFMGREVNAWALDIASKVIRGQLQPWWHWNNRRDWAEASRWLRGYTTDGRHTAAYITDGLCRDLAAAVNTEFSR